MTPEGKGYKAKDNPIKKPKQSSSKLKRKGKKAGKY